MQRMRDMPSALQGEVSVPSRPRPKVREAGDRIKTTGRRKTADRKSDFPPAESSGYLVRDAHRAFQRLLERRIADYGVTRGQWYFLRVLWNEDGLSQRELSARVGMMEPTTVIALRSMERSGLIRRVRSRNDRRRSQVWLTAKAKRLRNSLLAVARGITDQAENGIARADRARFRRVIARMTANLDRIRS
jgi:MarR family transcriptional regulator, organic hydroperoxide resistance regulator